MDPRAMGRTDGMPTQAPLGNAWDSVPTRSPPGFQHAHVLGTSAADTGRRPRVANEHFPELELKDLNRIFDNKMAASSQFQYNGGKEGEKWKKKVRGYLVSQCSDIAPILDFAEDLGDEPLTKERLQAESGTYRWMTELNVVKLGDELWGWLNTALLDKAPDYFEGAGELIEFDGWGCIVQQIHKGGKTRDGTLRRLIKQMPNIAKLEDIESGTIRFEAIMRDLRPDRWRGPDRLRDEGGLRQIFPRELAL